MMAIPITVVRPMVILTPVDSPPALSTSPSMSDGSILAPREGSVILEYVSSGMELGMGSDVETGASVRVLSPETSSAGDAVGEVATLSEEIALSVTASELSCWQRPSPPYTESWLQV